MKFRETMQQVGVTGYILQSLLGIPIQILLVIFYCVAARWCDPAPLSLQLVSG